MALMVPERIFGASDKSKLKSIIVEENIKVNEDVFEFVDSFTNKGIIVGDLIIIGRNVLNEGLVHGDIIGINLLTNVSGETKGNVRVVSRELYISGTVYKNVSAYVKKLVLNKSGTVDGSITVWGDEVQLDGLVCSDLRGKVKTLIVTGKIKGNVEIEADSIIFGTNGKVEGNFNYTSTEEIPIPKSNIQGRIEYSKKVTLLERLGLKDKIKYIKFVKLTLDLYLRVLTCI